ncbi:hypothetical protein [Burkholderia vietnamiensis]|uniref:hypothetical protein n=1 Tax=Burkholderia vietnamiensis TaxID=60552 RepID=UPI001B937CE3|nr:hypothetical protein [Burkholderia vietnamiensis]MBR8283919.1 hypothetical protein [Burkholderia vietnamiensis]
MKNSVSDDWAARCSRRSEDDWMCCAQTTSGASHAIGQPPPGSSRESAECPVSANRDYWRDVKVPRRPLGRVRFEVTRQFATFVLLVLAYVGAAHAFGWGTALWGLSAYLLLDRQLTAAIARQRAKDEDLDRGRYAATRLLCDYFGITPEEVNVALLVKLFKAFQVANARRQDEAALKAEAAAQARADQETAAGKVRAAAVAPRATPVATATASRRATGQPRRRLPAGEPAFGPGDD